MNIISLTSSDSTVRLHRKCLILKFRQTELWGKNIPAKVQRISLSHDKGSIRRQTPMGYTESINCQKNKLHQKAKADRPINQLCFVGAAGLEAPL